MLARRISPDNPLLFAIEIVGEEIDDRNHSRFGKDGGVDERGFGSLQCFPVCRDAFRQADTQRPGSCRHAQLLWIDLGSGQQPPAAIMDFRALGKRAHSRVRRNDCENIGRATGGSYGVGNQNLADGADPNGSSIFESKVDFTTEDGARGITRRYAAAKRGEVQIQCSGQADDGVSCIDACLDGGRRNRVLIEIEVEYFGRGQWYEDFSGVDDSGLREFERATPYFQSRIVATQRGDSRNQLRSDPNATRLHRVRGLSRDGAPQRYQESGGGAALKKHLHQSHREVKIKPDLQAVLIEEWPERVCGRHSPSP